MRLSGRIWSTFLYLVVPGLFVVLWMMGLLLILMFGFETRGRVPWGIIFLLAVIVPAIIIVLLTERRHKRKMHSQDENGARESLRIQVREYYQPLRARSWCTQGNYPLSRERKVQFLAETSS